VCEAGLVRTFPIDVITRSASRRSEYNFDDRIFNVLGLYMMSDYPANRELVRSAAPRHILDQHSCVSQSRKLPAQSTCR
jgi:hypothetical protein